MDILDRVLGSVKGGCWENTILIALTNPCEGRTTNSMMVTLMSISTDVLKLPGSWQRSGSGPYDVQQHRSLELEVYGVL